MWQQTVHSLYFTSDKWIPQVSITAKCVLLLCLDCLHGSEWIVQTSSHSGLVMELSSDTWHWFRLFQGIRYGFVTFAKVKDQYDCCNTYFTVCVLSSYSRVPPSAGAISSLHLPRLSPPPVSPQPHSPAPVSPWSHKHQRPRRRRRQMTWNQMRGRMSATCATVLTSTQAPCSTISLPTRLGTLGRDSFTWMDSTLRSVQSVAIKMPKHLVKRSVPRVPHCRSL